ncbi:hypothetical protein JCM19236_4614 [Vibrio sp. JCM 19236]|nr:hypothetical protein JCM19236_4614 [Vibrio sp. JCM 19236]
MNRNIEPMTRVFSMVLAIFFGMGGLAKLLGVRVMHYPFVELGLSPWYGYLIAIMEVSFAIGVLVKSFASMSALGMTVIILGITYYHWSYFPPNAVIPDIVLLLLAIFVSYVRHDDCITVDQERFADPT